MVTRWGMSGLGLVAFKADEQQPFLGYELAQGREYSEATAARIDEEVLRLLGQIHDKARARLEGARERLDHLVEALLHEETLSAQELERILGPRADSQSETFEQGCSVDRSGGDELRSHNPRGPVQRS